MVDSIAVSVFVLFYLSLTNILEIRIFLKSETRTKRTLVVRRAGLSGEGGGGLGCVLMYIMRTQNAF